MRVISLWQPYASLLVYEFKRFETRPFAAPSTLFGEPIGIASTKNLKPEQIAAYEDRAFQHHYEPTCLPELSDLPFGCVLGTVEVIESVLMTPEFIAAQSPEERAFGDWRPGRYAWRCENSRPLREPLPARGAQGIWFLEDEKIQRQGYSGGQTRSPDLRRDLHVTER